MAKTTYSREELERQLAESRREFWAADATINNLELKLADMAEQLANAENKCAALATELEASGKLIDTLRQDKDKVIDMSIERINNLLSRAESAEKRIAELLHHLQCAHDFIEHTEAFGYEATNGILCCGDAQWNIDSSKAALASAGSVNWEG